MLQTASARKPKRLVAVCPDELHSAFFAIVDRTGESAGVILRRLVHEAVERAQRGEPVVAGITASAPLMTTGG